MKIKENIVNLMDKGVTHDEDNREYREYDEQWGDKR